MRKDCKSPNKYDRVMAMVLVFEEQVMLGICAYDLQMRRSDCEKDQFYNNMENKWDLQNHGKMIFGQGDFEENVRRRIDDIEDVQCA